MNKCLEMKNPDLFLFEFERLTNEAPDLEETKKYVKQVVEHQSLVNGVIYHGKAIIQKIGTTEDLGFSFLTDTHVVVVHLTKEMISNHLRTTQDGRFVFHQG